VKRSISVCEKMVVALQELGYSSGPLSVFSSDSSGAAQSEKTLELFAGFPL
jgi:hypothetical protein